jgi:glycosyltransferase involved in cell wall biosynthesis
MFSLQIGKFYYPAKGGIETHTRVLSTGLRQFCDVKVVVAGQPKASADCIDGIEIERQSAPVTLAGAPICPDLISTLRSTKADIVHVHLPNPWASMAYLMSGCRRPLVVGYHSDIVRQSLIEPLFRPILLKFLDRASTIISSSPDLIEHSPILKRFRQKCVVIPYGLDQRALIETDVPKVESIRSGYKKPIVLGVGRLVYYKGFEHLIGAMTEVDASLLIIGNGPLKENLVRLATSIGVSDKVTFLDKVDDVNPYHQAADLFVLSSVARSEAFAIVQLEAMAAGKPVINTQLESGVPFVSQHGITGLTVPPADKSALAAAINRLLGDADLRQRYGAAARLRAQQEFTVEKMVARTLEVYDKATSSPRQPVQELTAQRASA